MKIRQLYDVLHWDNSVGDWKPYRTQSGFSLNLTNEEVYFLLGLISGWNLCKGKKPVEPRPLDGFFDFDNDIVVQKIDVNANRL